MNRVVIVTGGSSGIGYATAKVFLQQGDKVIILSVNQAKGIAAEGRLLKYGTCKWMKCNVSDFDECKTVVNDILNEFGRIDVLVNNAGVVSKRNSFLEVDMSDVRKTIDIDLMGTIHMISAVSVTMVQQKKGVIVNVGSICGRMANTESVGYHAAKGAVEMITKSLARELSGYGIRIVCVAPGWVHTEMVDDEVAEIGGTLHLKGRIIEPEEIAGAISLLSMDEASAINGTTVMVDDGYSAFKGIQGGVTQ